MTSPPTPTVAPGPRQPIVRVFDCHVARPAPDGWRWLLLRRAAGKLYAGSWRMVGGKLRADETAWQGCLRELHEELGLRPAALMVVPYLNRFYEWQHDRVNEIPVFVALAPAEPGFSPTLDDEHDAYEWLALEAAAARLPWPGQRAGLEAADRLLRHGHDLQPFLTIEPPAGR